MTRPARKDRPTAGATLVGDPYAGLSLSVIVSGLACLGAPELPGPARALLCSAAFVVACVVTAGYR